MNSFSAPLPNQTFHRVLASLRAIAAGWSTPVAPPDNAAAKASAAHERALARAAGSWGGFQAARPVAPQTADR